jgi:hypothetical protein
LSRAKDVKRKIRLGNIYLLLGSKRIVKAEHVTAIECTLKLILCGSYGIGNGTVEIAY